MPTTATPSPWPPRPPCTPARPSASWTDDAGGVGVLGLVQRHAARRRPREQLEKALAIREACLDPRDRTVAVARNNLISLYQHTNDHRRLVAQLAARLRGPHRPRGPVARARRRPDEPVQGLPGPGRPRPGDPAQRGGQRSWSTTWSATATPSTPTRSTTWPRPAWRGRLRPGHPALREGPRPAGPPGRAGPLPATCAGPRGAA